MSREIHKVDQCFKIAYVITRSDAIAGAQIHLADIAGAAVESGHRVLVLVGQEGPFTELLACRGISFVSLHHLVRPIHLSSDFRALSEMMKHLRNFKPDILSLHSSKAGWLGRVAGFLLGIPTVFTAHGWAFSEGVSPLSKYFYTWSERIAAPFARKIITVSDYDRKLAIRYHVANSDRLITVLNGAAEVPESLLARPQIEPPRMIMVARFDIPKDHALLFNALAALDDLEWQLDLVGDGPFLGKMEKLARDLNISHNVRFLGASNNVAKLLADAQIFVLVSNYEGFPLSIVEAMRAGLPVVASDVGGCRESVFNGRTGYLIPRGDVITLKERLRDLLLCPELRARMGVAGRKRFKADFTLAQMYERTIRVYQEVIAANQITKFKV